MNFRRPGPLAFLALAACGYPSPHAGPSLSDPAAEARRLKDEEIVAICDGRPLSWRSVAEHAMESDLKSAVDQYVRSRIVEDRRTALGIFNTPADLRRRAETLVKSARTKLGDDAFHRQLSSEGFTEEAYLEHLSGSRLLDEALALERIVRTEELRQGMMEIDRMVFLNADDARGFSELCGEKGFDGAADAFGAADRVTRRPRETFPCGIPPSPPSAPLLDFPILEILGLMKPGEITGALASRSNLHYVIRLKALKPGRNLPPGEEKSLVLDGIFTDPPGTADIKRWIDAEFTRTRIEYAGRRHLRGQDR